MKALRWLGFLLVGLYLTVGLVWGAVHLGEVPHYGDTLEYLKLADEMRTHQRRGFLYPWILHRTCQIFLDGKVPRPVSFKDEEEAVGAQPCNLPPEFAFLQALQILVSMAGMAYFIHVVWPRHEGEESPPFSQPGPWIVLLLLVLDPLILHLNLSLMTDGLTTSAGLVFCAALADFASRRSSPFVSGFLLLLSGWLCAGLRVEKKWILLATVAVTVLVRMSLLRRNTGLVGRDVVRSSVVAVLLVALTVGSAMAVQARSSYVNKWWWPLGEEVLHTRLVFPHLSDVYEDLSEKTRALLSPEDARRYDNHLNNIQRVINRVTKNDEALRHELTRDLVRTVLSRKWPVIALDVVRDTLENLFITVPFYVRVAIWRIGGWRAIENSFDSGVAVWDFTRLQFHHPKLSGGLILIFAAVFLTCLPVALRDAWRWIGSESFRDVASWVAPWIPALSFWVLNALAFAMAMDVINLRYMVMSHALLLCLVYGSGVRWWLRHEEPCARIGLQE